MKKKEKYNMVKIITGNDNTLLKNTDTGFREEKKQTYIKKPCRFKFNIYLRKKKLSYQELNIEVTKELRAKNKYASTHILNFFFRNVFHETRIEG